MVNCGGGTFINNFISSIKWTVGYNDAANQWESTSFPANSGVYNNSGNYVYTAHLHNLNTDSVPIVLVYYCPNWCQNSYYN